MTIASWAQTSKTSRIGSALGRCRPPFSTSRSLVPTQADHPGGVERRLQPGDVWSLRQRPGKADGGRPDPCIRSPCRWRWPTPRRIPGGCARARTSDASVLESSAWTTSSATLSSSSSHGDIGEETEEGAATTGSPALLPAHLQSDRRCLGVRDRHVGIRDRLETESLTGLHRNQHLCGCRCSPGGGILTTEIPDRLVQHVHIVHIDGRSYRLREIDGFLSRSKLTPVR